MRKRALILVASMGAVLLLQAPQVLSAQELVGKEAKLRPKVKDAVAYAKSRPLRELPKPNPNRPFSTDPGEREDGPTGDRGYTGDGALQTTVTTTAMPGPLFTFEGPSNQDNFNTFGFRVNPPDPVGDVGKDQYVAMINLVYSVYSKTGELLGGPFDTGTLWQGFAVEDCTDPSGDPIVFYDEIANRWVLTQFTTRFATRQFYICMAVSATPDALGEYHLYAFSTGDAFPDYPKYGLWRDAYVFTTREFDNGGVGPEQIGIYAVKRTDLIGGKEDPRMVQFTLTGPPNLVGDGLLPADIDGKRLPHPDTPIPLAGAQDDDAFDGATFDALNVFHLNVKWSKLEESTFSLAKQVPISEYDTNYPCNPPTRDCLEQPPPATNTTDKLDILSYRQRPMHRLQYRNFGTHESLVTNQSVEARPNVAGLRWWELRNPADPVLHQEGTWSPDNTHRWMGSVAMDRDGNLALGYSVVSTTVFPGIRYAGRLAGDPLGQLTQGEAELQTGSGVQRTTNSRWGDYTSMNLDPNDDCTFYYINEYYTAASQLTSTAGWLTRIGVFKFPSCKPGN